MGSMNKAVETKTFGTSKNISPKVKVLLTHIFTNTKTFRSSPRKNTVPLSTYNLRNSKEGNKVVENIQGGKECELDQGSLSKWKRRARENKINKKPSTPA